MMWVKILFYQEGFCPVWSIVQSGGKDIRPEVDFVVILENEV